MPQSLDYTVRLPPIRWRRNHSRSSPHLSPIMCYHSISWRYYRRPFLLTFGSRVYRDEQNCIYQSRMMLNYCILLHRWRWRCRIAKKLKKSVCFFNKNFLSCVFTAKYHLRLPRFPRKEVEGPIFLEHARNSTVISMYHEANLRSRTTVFFAPLCGDRFHARWSA